MFTPDPGSRIPDPKTATKEGGEKNLLSYSTFLRSYKFHKIGNYFSFEVLKKKNWANFQRILELFTQKIVPKLSKIWVRDPGSEIRDPEKTYSGSRIQGSKRHRIPDPGSATLPTVHAICKQYKCRCSNSNELSVKQHSSAVFSDMPKNKDCFM
jgi:hypothetical protein